MPQAAPVISVQLNAKGVADVTQAFAQMRQQGVAASQDTAKGFDVVTDGLKGLQDLIPEIAAGVLIEQIGAALVEAGKQALDYATSMGKLSEKTGVAVGTLSALALAAREAGVDQDALSAGLVKLTRSAEEAGEGAAKPKQAFHDLGISLNDLKTKDPGELFIEIATGLQKIQDPGTRANDIVALFGKSGNELVPVLKKVADEGLQGLVDKAQRLGIYLSADFVESARKAEGELADLKAVSEGVALQFITGMLPAVEKLLCRLSSFAGTGGDFKSWGQSVGEALIDAAEKVELFICPLDHLAARIKTIIADFRLISTANDALDPKSKTPLKERTANVRDAYQDRMDAASDVNDYDSASYEKDVKAKYDAMRGELAKEATKPVTPDPKRGTIDPNATGVSKEEATKAEEQAKKDAAARIALRESEANNEIQLLKARNSEEEALEAEKYKNGLVTLEQYYDDRATRINEAADAEEAALRTKMTAAQAMPQKTDEDRSKRLEEIGKVQTAIDLAEMARQSQLAQNDQARDKAKHDAAVQQLEDQKKLQEASGDKFGAQETGLKLDAQSYEDQLKKQGQLSASDRAAAVKSYTDKGEAKIDFGRWDQSGSNEMASMNRQIGDIQDQASAGLITQLDAQTQILAVEQRRLPLLQQISAEMMQDAKDSGDDDLIAKAEAFNDTLVKLQRQAKVTYSATTDLVNQLETQGIQATESFFTSFLSGQKSASQALGDLANAFEQMIAAMVGKLLVLYAVEALVGWITGGDKTAVAAAGKLVTGHQSGGFTADVGEDEVAGIVHGGEYVVDAKNTRRYRPMWEAMEAGLHPAAGLPSPSSSFSDGLAPMPFRTRLSAGIVLSQAAHETANRADKMAAAAPEVHIHNTTGQPTKTTQTKGSNGQSITSIVVGQMKTAFANGTMDKTMTSQYGVNRAGVNRGNG